MVGGNIVTNASMSLKTNKISCNQMSPSQDWNPIEIDSAQDMLFIFGTIEFCVVFFFLIVQRKTTFSSLEYFSYQGHFSRGEGLQYNAKYQLQYASMGGYPPFFPTSQ